MASKPRCPLCGDPVRIAGTNNSGGVKTGRQRWSHGKPHDCRWHGTQPIGLELAESEGIDRKRVAKLHRKIKRDKRRVKRYLISSAQNATPIRANAFATCMGFCRINNAQFIAIPYRYKNVTSMWSKKAETDDWWSKEVRPYLLDQRLSLNKNLVILADIKTQPTANSPLQGFETMAAGQSAIVGHPKLELTTVATPHKKLPKILTTTGSITEKNYIPSKAGKKGEFHHTFGACVVEVVGDKFHIRQINILNDGTFMDIGKPGEGVWEYDGDTRRPGSMAGIVMGDSHVKFMDPLVEKATFGKNGMVPTLRPEALVWNDVLDFYAGNHHESKDTFVNYVKHHTGHGNVEAEVDQCFKFVDDHSLPGVLNVFVASNHPNDHFNRWVRETDPRTDPENCVFWAQTFEAMCKGSHMSAAGAKTIDPFIYWGKRKLKKLDQCRFLDYDESFQIHGIEVGFHGHKGLNGARGSRAQYGKIGVKTVIGHSHSPGIRDGVYQTGTSTLLRLSYNSGPSSWMQTHCGIYGNGKRTLLNMIDGEYRA